MNTVEKGDKLENAIFNFFSEEILAGRYWVKQENCKIFMQKGYYSRDREKDIIFDVSIEVYLPGQDQYSILILIECKNYGHKVPVDDIEEFYAKVQQVTGANIKAIVASTNSFQEGSLKFAKSKGIGLLRFFEQSTSEWILTRSPSKIKRTVDNTKKSSILMALSQEDFIGKGFELYGYYGAGFTNSSHEFFRELLRVDIDDALSEKIATITTSEPVSKTCVPYVDYDFIQSECDKFLDVIGYLDGSVQHDVLVRKSQEYYGLELDLNAVLPKGILGTVDLFNNLIKVDAAQCGNEQRMRFTLAHELGHAILGHSEYITYESCYDSHLNEARDDVSIKDIIRLEWQANQFASCLLLPKKQFITAFARQALARGVSDRGFGPLFVDDQQCNLNTSHLITISLMKSFNVSKTVVIIRLKQLGIMRG